MLYSNEPNQFGKTHLYVIFYIAYSYITKFVFMQYLDLEIFTQL